MVWDVIAMPKLEKAKVWKCLQKPASVKDQKKLKIENEHRNVAWADIVKYDSSIHR